jgi:hypothetical protein
VSGRLLLGALVVAACTGGSAERIGSERLLTIHPRLVSSYILTTVQGAILDLEPLREYVCEPERHLVAMCQRAERTRSALQYTQTQLTRLLGDAPEREPMLMPTPGGPPLPRP